MIAQPALTLLQCRRPKLRVIGDPLIDERAEQLAAASGIDEVTAQLVGFDNRQETLCVDLSRKSLRAFLSVWCAVARPPSPWAAPLNVGHRRPPSSGSELKARLARAVRRSLLLIEAELPTRQLPRLGLGGPATRDRSYRRERDVRCVARDARSALIGSEPLVDVVEVEADEPPDLCVRNSTVGHKPADV